MYLPLCGVFYCSLFPNSSKSNVDLSRMYHANVDSGCEPHFCPEPVWAPELGRSCCLIFIRDARAPNWSVKTVTIKNKATNFYFIRTEWKQSSADNTFPEEIIRCHGMCWEGLNNFLFSTTKKRTFFTPKDLGEGKPTSCMKAMKTITQILQVSTQAQIRLFPHRNKRSYHSERHSFRCWWLFTVWNHNIVCKSCKKHDLLFRFFVP